VLTVLRSILGEVLQGPGDQGLEIQFRIAGEPEGTIGLSKPFASREIPSNSAGNLDTGESATKAPPAFLPGFRRFTIKQRSSSATQHAAISKRPAGLELEPRCGRLSPLAKS